MSHLHREGPRSYSCDGPCEELTNLQRLESALAEEREKCARLEAILNDTEGKLQRARVALTDQVLVCDDLRAKLEAAKLQLDAWEKTGTRFMRERDEFSELADKRRLLLQSVDVALRPRGEDLLDARELPDIARDIRAEIDEARAALEAHLCIAEFRHQQAAAAYVQDRAEQYPNSSGYRSAIETIAAALAAGEHLEALRHGELDDLVK